MWWFLVGCGPVVAELPIRHVALCTAWTDISDAVVDGQVVFCDAGRLVVHYPPASAERISTGWREGVRAMGFTEDLDSTAPGLVNVRYRLGETGVLALSAIDQPARTTLILTLLASPVGTGEEGP